MTHQTKCFNEARRSDKYVFIIIFFKSMDSFEITRIKKQFLNS